MKYIKAFNETANVNEKFMNLKAADAILAELERMPNLPDVKLEKIRNKRKQIHSMLARYEDM